MNPIQKITRQSLLQLVPRTRKARIVTAGAVFMSMCAFGAIGVAPIAPDASDLPVKSIEQNLELPNLADQIAALQQDEQQFIREERIRPGDSLGSLFTRLGGAPPAAGGPPNWGAAASMLGSAWATMGAGASGRCSGR